jgi:hypothetical protein
MLYLCPISAVHVSHRPGSDHFLLGLVLELRAVQRVLFANLTPLFPKDRFIKHVNELWSGQDSADCRVIPVNRSEIVQIVGDFDIAGFECDRRAPQIGCP